VEDKAHRDQLEEHLDGEAHEKKELDDFERTDRTGTEVSIPCMRRGPG
jgi:hypothetical protein